MIGGLGGDAINGGDGEDILIAGTTHHDANPQSLKDILFGWLGVGTYLQRTTVLRNGTGVPQLKAKITVTKDANADTLNGGKELDWYFKSVDDAIADMMVGESLEDLT